MPLQATSGAASYDAFGGGAAAVPNYIEDVFSTWLYTGNGSTQTITNGIDLAGKGGLVWLKSRSAIANHGLTDTAKGVGSVLRTNTTGAAVTTSADIASFNANGFSLTDPNVSGTANVSDRTYASWTFREQPKFFDVVTYSGSSSTQNISHNLGSVPGCIIVKRTSGVEDWFVYHTSLGNTQYLKLNTDGAAASGFAAWNNTSPTSTQFTVLGGRTEVNASGSTYVAYLFAHDAGGFGLTGTDNVISCGSFTTDGSGNATVNLGYEPQWMMLKTTGSGGWFIRDTMRGFVCDTSGTSVFLTANTSNAESSGTGNAVTATGTSHVLAANTTYIYIAIRRGPMKVPTTGTSVFVPLASSASTGTAQTTGFPVDMQIAGLRTVAGSCDHYVDDRLRGVSSTTTEQGVFLKTNATDAEATTLNLTRSWGNTGYAIPSDLAGSSSIYWNFRRAPGFFDEVCYTGTGSSASSTINHNLGVAPEMIITKCRNDGSFQGKDWKVWTTSLSTTVGSAKSLYLNLTAAQTNDDSWAGLTRTATTYSIPYADYEINASGKTYVSYLFASVAGVSKVGSYTGTGATQTINCGFTGGARFVMVKRTDSTGDWYVWDTARGIVAGNDPRLSLNTTAAEVTTDDSVDTDSTGFVVNQLSATNINVSSATYIYLAIA